MTSLQIEYWKNLENHRHNLEMERLTGEAQSETARHNVQSERIGYAQASAAYYQAETQRKLYELQQIRTDYDIMIAQHQMKYTDSQINLNKSRAQYQDLQNQVYAQWGGKTAEQEYNIAYNKARQGTWDYTVSTLFDADTRRADILRDKTTAWKNIADMGISVAKGIQTVASLFA